MRRIHGFQWAVFIVVITGVFFGCPSKPYVPNPPLPKTDTTLIIRLNPAHAKYDLKKADGTLVLAGKSGDQYLLNDPSIWNGATSLDCEAEIQAPGYLPLKKEIRIDRTKDYDLAFVLQELRTVLEIQSDPAGAEVSEKALGIFGLTPLIKEISYGGLIRKGLILDPDKDSVAQLLLTFRKDGFKPLDQIVRVDIRQSETRKITVVLEKNKT